MDKRICVCVLCDLKFVCVCLYASVFKLCVCVSAHVQASRAMMVCACLLGLPAMLLVLTSTSCVRLPHDPNASKKRRARVGGGLILLMGEGTRVFLGVFG